MPNLDLNILQIMHGDTAVHKIMQGDSQVWPYVPYDSEVEYLEASGTQYIDTGYTCNNKCKVEVRYKANGTAVYGIFGSRVYVRSLSKSFHIYSLNTGQMQFGFNAKSAEISSATQEAHVYVLDHNNYYIDGTNIGTLTNATFTCSSTALLFTSHTGSNAATVESRMLNGAIYYCKLWDDGTLVRDYIPVRYNGVGYMYDKVNGQLYGNIGSGSFTYGSDV